MEVLYAFINTQELRALIEPTSPLPDAAATPFNLPDYRVTCTKILAFGQRRVRVEAHHRGQLPIRRGDQPPGFAPAYHNNYVTSPSPALLW